MSSTAHRIGSSPTTSYAEPVRKADRQCGHLLQLCHSVAAADEVRGERLCQGTRAHHPDIARGMVAIPAERVLHLQSDGKMIDLDALGLIWGDGNFWGSGLQPLFD